MSGKPLPILELRHATFVERYWLWDSRAEEWMLHERKYGPVLQYRLAPAAAWHSVPEVEIITKDPPKPPDD